eukprot:CAMPEP_0181309798 /NCGR_PEP_ID=MMETSP1101-20121128/12219_1 /TAXON_ID=46948 /ORGANISM="Rhodomonas abbreviata, Strain Caron Lab Isolate" /LENGTH=459 /DNA_ID=CAMNT_0023416333 /DNA_START=227 /DNA_END=1604 /DNA_ORIENTATION=+
MGDLSQWVSDQLHGLLGMSEKNLCEYVIALAKRSKNETTLLASLQDNGVEVNDESRRFALQLMKKVPKPEDTRKLDKALAAKKQEKERQRQQVEMLRQNAEYTMLDDAEDKAEEAAKAKKLAKLEKKEAKREEKEAKKEEKKEKETAAAEEEQVVDDEDEQNEEPSSKKPKPNDDDDDDDEDHLEPWELEELQRMRDLEERDAFAERLKKRDEAKTKKLIGEKDTGLVEDEDGTLREQTAEERQAVMEDTRILSRQMYLKKREDKKMQELVEAIEDEKRLFADVELTAKEKREMKIKQTLLDLVNKRKEVEDVGPAYVMPDAYDDSSKPESRSKRYKVLDNRYDEIEDTVMPTDQDVHESLQIEHANLAVGRKKEKAVRGEEFELVIDDQVDFVRDKISSDEVNFLEAPDEESQKERRARSMMEERMSLPIWPYRQQLLDAIAEEQILIIVGETGSGKT